MSELNIAEELAEALGLEDDIEIAGEAETEFSVHKLYDEHAGVLVRRGKEPNTVVVGYLSHDDDAADFFENDDGAGELKIFRDQIELDDCVKTFVSEGKVALVVDKYEHSSVHYSIAGTRGYPDRRWDVAPCGVFVPCDDVQENYAKALAAAGESTEARQAAWQELVTDCNGTLNAYSQWCNGEVYGVVTETWTWSPESRSFERTDDDACWGYIGYDNAKKTLEGEVASLTAEEEPAPGP